MLGAIPMRTAALHICCDEEYARMRSSFIAMLKLGLDYLTKFRVRVHVGTPTEVAYALVCH